jgi:hypothetical protein
MTELLQHHPGWLFMALMIVAFALPVLELWRERNRLEGDNEAAWKLWKEDE